MSIAPALIVSIFALAADIRRDYPAAEWRIG
jgi:hypothetical protein